MKILKASGTYLEGKKRLYLKIALITLILAVPLFFLYGIGLIFIIVSAYCFIKRQYYARGIRGESLTVKHLKELSDDYFLLNDVNLPESYGNIDHIVLGPNGIFVIETKDYEGRIRCEGDIWYQYKTQWKWPIEHEIKSPSKQVKRNAVILKKFIKKPMWIEGIVAFTNKVELELKDPKVQILKIKDVPSFIENKKSGIRFSSKEIEDIVRLILGNSPPKPT